MRARRSFVIAGLIAAVALVLVVLLTKDESESVRAQATAQPVAARAPRAPTPNLEQATTAPAAPVPPPAAPSEVASPVRPEVKPLTQDEYVKRRESGLELLDDTIARVEREREEATKANDDERAALARVRLQRLAAVRKQRAEELEQARRGELQPSPNDRPAGPRPE